MIGGSFKQSHDFRVAPSVKTQEYQYEHHTQSCITIVLHSDEDV